PRPTVIPRTPGTTRIATSAINGAAPTGRSRSSTLPGGCAPVLADRSKSVSMGSPWSDDGRLERRGGDEQDGSRGGPRRGGEDGAGEGAGRGSPADVGPHPHRAVEPGAGKGDKGQQLGPAGRRGGGGGGPAEVGDVGAEDVAGGHRAAGRDAGGTDPEGEPAEDADRQPEAQVVAQDVEPAEVGAAGGDLLDLVPDRPGDEQREEDDDGSRHAQRRLALSGGRSRRRRHGH